MKPFYRLSSRMIGMLLVLSICLAASPHSSAMELKCKFHHKVQPGDTLIGLGLLYQIDWREIAEANDLKEPYVLTVGVKICIPGGSKPNTVTTTTAEGVTTVTQKKPTGTVIGFVNTVYIKLEFFPRSTVYYVKVQPWGSTVSYRIGRIRTNKNGNAEDQFNIPWYIQVTPKMTLCIKDVWTDEVGCVVYENPYIIQANKKYTVPKLGR